MACVSFHRDFAVRKGVPGADKAAKPGLLRRLLAAVLASRQRKADRELATYLLRSGGRLTDDIEREMNRRLTGGDWNFRA